MTKEEKTRYKTVKDKLGITDVDVAKLFGYASVQSFRNSSGQDKVKNGVVGLYDIFSDKLKDLFDAGK